MDRKKILKRMAQLVFFIFILNFIAGKLYWYISIWYFDMPMHFLGGVFVGLLAVYCSKFVKINLLELNFKEQILYVFLFTLIVGIGWEFFEIIFNNILGGQFFNTLDTISDICFDLSGGLASYFVIMNKNMKVV
ncbi:MAG: hypothetical protein NTW62_00795 [Candidatus Nomurabacteria bacterium]|nr:hypothetical protein [Candidatus Nomurabacteria bacterium]